MKYLKEKYLKGKENLVIVDLGAMDIGGTYRPIFNNPTWKYIGVDIEKGPNVDMLQKYPYRLPFASNSIDVVISGQLMEHLEYFWVHFEEQVRISKSGGYIFMIAPSGCKEHRYPVDCWRFFPDGFAALAKYTGVQSLEIFTDSGKYGWGEWITGDTVGVFSKIKRTNILHQFLSRFFSIHVKRMRRYQV